MTRHGVSPTVADGTTNRHQRTPNPAGGQQIALMMTQVVNWRESSQSSWMTVALVSRLGTMERMQCESWSDDASLRRRHDAALTIDIH